MLTVDNLTVHYDDIPAITDVSFQVPTGETRAIIGPSGCGKTTLIYTIAGLRTPSTGEVLLEGEKPRAGQRDLAVILQDFGLLPWKTVAGNIGLGLRLRGLKQTEAVDRLLQELDLTEIRDHYPAQISGGQRQRVAIGRALAINPRLLLMDEPFSALDAITREELQSLFLRLWRKRRMTTLLVTHSIEEAVYLGQRILVFSGKPGTIIADIPNPAFGCPAARETTEFYRICSYLRQRLREAKERTSPVGGSDDEHLN